MPHVMTSFENEMMCLFIYLQIKWKMIEFIIKKKNNFLFMSWQLNAKYDEVMWRQYCIVWNVYKVCFSYY